MSVLLNFLFYSGCSKFKLFAALCYFLVHKEPFATPTSPLGSFQQKQQATHALPAKTMGSLM